MTITQENKASSLKWFLDWMDAGALKLGHDLALKPADQEGSDEINQCFAGQGPPTLAKLEKLQWNENIPVINASHIKPLPPSLEEMDIKPARIESIEHGPLNQVKAIVLHQTDSATAAKTIEIWKDHNPNRVGAHFVIDTDGTIYQTAELDKKTQHVGLIQVRCKNENSCDKKEKEILSTLTGPQQIHQHELAKSYPNRYPYNGDSIGIEVVGLFDKKTNTYGPPTEAQKRSLDLLVNAIREKHGLRSEDVHVHSRIGRKQETEAIYLGY